MNTTPEIKLTIETYNSAFCDPVAVERERNALRQVVLDVLCDPDGKACFRGSDADRAAIDAAMKEGIK